MRRASEVPHAPVLVALRGALRLIAWFRTWVREKGNVLLTTFLGSRFSDLNKISKNSAKYTTSERCPLALEKTNGFNYSIHARPYRENQQVLEPCAET
ncbi:hypothetical protein DES53_112100 [Roseimicrobium gellanilyticum]|uniref:Uncharacterized protein n=1 Tax=Roseimicrobium gellanilyticum TaxID=748857 RepID=A0A366H7F4_9BACT|nr:hypothetical protein DES53_112100 [Roseimicrobium gellanilyticum]